MSAPRTEGSSSRGADDEVSGVRDLLASSPVGAVLLDSEGRFTTVNPEFLRRLGRQESDFLGKTVTEVTPPLFEPEMLRTIADRVKRRLKTGEAVTNVEIQILDAAGRPVPISYSASGVRDKAGRIVGEIVFAVDMTERKRAEREARERHEQLLSIFDGIDDVIYVSDPDSYELLYANPTFRAAWGEDCLGKKCYRVIQGRGEPCPFCTNDKILGAFLGKAYVWEFQNEKDKRWYRCADKAIRWRDGKMVRFELASDITEMKESQQRLERERAFSDSIISSLPGLFYVIGADARLRRWNDNLERVSGYGSEEIAAMSPTDFFSGDEKALIAQRVQQVFDEGWANVEADLVARDGRRVPHHFTGRRVELDGEPLLIGVGMDITERRKAEQALQSSQLFLQNAFDAIRDGISVLDADLNVVRTNRWMEEMYSHRAPLKGKKCYEVYQQRESPCPRCPSLRAFETGEAQTEIVPYPSAEKQERWVEVSAFRVEDEEGRAVNVIECVRDVTERERAKLDLVRAEAQAREIGKLKQKMLLAANLQEQLKGITDAVVDIFDADFARVWVVGTGDKCDRGCVHAELTEGPHVCSNRTKCLHLEASSGRYTHTDGGMHHRVPFGCYKIGRVAAGDDPKFLTNDAAHDPRVHDHEWVKRLGLVSFAGYRLLSSDGKPLGVLALFSKHPISAKDDACLEDVAATASLVIQTAQAKAAHAVVQAQLLQSQKLESLGTLAGGVAHEINNPAFAIMNYAQLIKEELGARDDTADKFAGEIIRETERIAAIVRNLLSFARHEEQHHSTANLSHIVKDTVSLIRTVLRLDKIDLEVDVPEGLPELNCHSQRIQQVIMNLVTNARDALNDQYPASDENKRIRVSARRMKRNGRPWLRITVEDGGAGIPETIRDHIFDPFYTTKPQGKGTGLGLSVSHGIVRDHHGELSVESEPGAWTRFHVDLPVSDHTDASGS